MTEEYTLSVVCPLGTVVGPGRYDMYWVAHSHAMHPTIEGEIVGTIFRSVMPADLTAALDREEPNSVAEIGLRAANRRDRK